MLSLFQTNPTKHTTKTSIIHVEFKHDLISESPTHPSDRNLFLEQILLPPSLSPKVRSETNGASQQRRDIIERIRQYGPPRSRHILHQYLGLKPFNLHSISERLVTIPIVRVAEVLRVPIVVVLRLR